MAKRVTVEIIAVGNEILIGDVQDTNTHWLCQEITGLGGRIRRGSLVRDDLGAIAAEVRAALARETDVVFTSGGLGPTADDLTLRGVAQGAGLVVERHEKALRMVSDRYDELATEGIVDAGGLNPAREKMACLPEGAMPLYNSVGTAPGVLLRVEETTIICLPGVPAELKGIFGDSLQPFLRETLSEGLFVEWVVIAECKDESLLAPAVGQIADDHSEVYVKSRAKPFGESTRFKITLSAGGDDRAEVEARLDAALSDLEAELAAAEISLHEIEK